MKAKTIIITRRSRSGGGTSLLKGEHRWGVASVMGGRADLELVVVDGVFHPPAPKPARDWDLFSYPLGAVTVLAGGFNWGGGGVVHQPFASRVADETFDSYAVGPVASGQLNAGSGWSAAAEVGTAYARHAAGEDFESYASGPASPGALTGGYGWAGAPIITPY